MPSFARILFTAAMLTASSAAVAAGWKLAMPELVYEDGGKPLYRFVCGPADVAVSQYGVTKLLDLQTNRTIGDGPGAAMTPGASVMALATGKGEPQFVPATAVANPAGGWDMTIHLAKNDPALAALAKAKMVSLFTTGVTGAIELGKEDRKRLADFVSRCRAG